MLYAVLKHRVKKSATVLSVVAPCSSFKLVRILDFDFACALFR